VQHTTICLWRLSDKLFVMQTDSFHENVGYAMHCFSLVMYGAFESVAVLWRLRSHRYIIIIIIIIITTLLTSKQTHNTDWIEYRFLSTRGQRQRKTQGEDAHVHKVDGLPAAAAARDQQKINENELKEKSMSIRNPKSLSVREGSLMGSSSIQRLCDLSGSMRTLLAVCCIERPSVFDLLFARCECAWIWFRNCSTVKLYLSNGITLTPANHGQLQYIQ